MTPARSELLIFTFGCLTGLRSFTPTAVLCIFARKGNIPLAHTPLAFLGSRPAAIIAPLLATGELVADKLPKAPSRLSPPGLSGRFILGGLAGVALAMSQQQSLLPAALTGALGGLAGAFFGYQVRTNLVRILESPDWPVALLEDAVAIGGSLYVITRF